MYMDRELVKVPSCSRRGVCILRWSVLSEFRNHEYGIRLRSIYLDAHPRGVRMEFSQSLLNAVTANSIHLNKKHLDDEVLYTHAGKNGFYASRTISMKLLAKDQGYLPGAPSKRYVIQGLSVQNHFPHFFVEWQCEFPRKG